ncbi:hypothetical protein [Planktotalea sp.]|uniref:hypothetical protein n=1 Tax=Planktotalea sp. TaxID=2029877 RepID=UPI0035C7B4D6
MDFSQPIFGSGIQILLPKEAALSDQFLSLMGGDTLLYVLGAVLLVVIGWFLMRAATGVSGGVIGVVAMVGGFALLLVAAGTIREKSDGNSVAIGRSDNF